MVISRRSGLIEAEVDGELIGLHIENGSCYGFNRTATRIWSLIEQPTSLGEICAALVAEFRIGREECEQQVIALLENLKRQGLVDLSFPSAGGAA